MLVTVDMPSTARPILGSPEHWNRDIKPRSGHGCNLCLLSSILRCFG